MLEHCGCTPAKCNKTAKGKMCPKHGMSDCSMKEERDPKGSVKPYKSPEEKVSEGNLHQWFKGSRSKDGKPGWVNVVTGGTCASDEPGEGTPKCVSSSKRSSMTKAERLSASRRKKEADPGQQSKSGAAKPTYVSTDSPTKKMKKEEFMSEEDKKGRGSGKKDACYHKVKARYSVWPSAYASGALVKCRQKGAKNWGNKSEEFFPEDHKEVASGKKKDEEGYMSNVEFDQIERSINILRKLIKKPNQQIPAWVQSKITRAADFIDTAADYMQSDEKVSEACWDGYKRKKGTKKFAPGSCVKEQNYVMSSASQTGAYSGGVKGKSYKVGDTIPSSATKPKPKPSRFSVDKTGLEGPKNPLGENIDKIQQYGRTYTIILTWHGSTYRLQIFFSTPTIPSRKEVEDAIHKVYPGALLNAYMPSRIDPTKPTLLAAEEVEIDEAVLGRYKEDRGGGKTLRPASERTKPKSKPEEPKGPKITVLKRRGPRKGEATASQVQGWRGSDRTNTNRRGQSAPHAKPVKENFAEQALAIILDPDKEKRRKNYLLNIGVIGEDWQEKNRKDGVDGLSQSTVDAYRRENPGSKLQTAVTEKNPTGKRASRRKSFCSRMKGHKAKNTSAKPARDPDSRINKALRRWNCN